MDDVAEEIENHGDERAKLDDGNESRSFLIVFNIAEQSSGDGQVGRAADGEEFSKALNQTEDDGVNDGHPLEFPFADRNQQTSESMITTRGCQRNASYG